MSVMAPSHFPKCYRKQINDFTPFPHIFHFPFFFVFYRCPQEQSKAKCVGFVRHIVNSCSKHIHCCWSTKWDYWLVIFPQYKGEHTYMLVIGTTVGCWSFNMLKCNRWQEQHNVSLLLFQKDCVSCVTGNIEGLNKLIIINNVGD